jgi:hypothetical protein
MNRGIIYVSLNILCIGFRSTNLIRHCSHIHHIWLSYRQFRHPFPEHHMTSAEVAEMRERATFAY